MYDPFLRDKIISDFKSELLQNMWTQWLVLQTVTELRLESDQVTATTGEHYHPPRQAQASANTVNISMKKRAQEESVPLSQTYSQEMTKLYGAPGYDETALLYCSSISRSMPTRLLLPFLTGDL